MIRRDGQADDLDGADIIACALSTIVAARTVRAYCTHSWIAMAPIEDDGRPFGGAGVREHMRARRR